MKHGMVHGLLLTAGFMAVCGCVPRQNSAAPAEDRIRETAYTLNLPDPVQPKTGLQPVEVIQTTDKNGFILNYRMHLRADVCPDGQNCRKLDVTAYWDALGHFQKIEVPPDTPLTKMNGQAFTPDDYARLDAILKDTGSLLGELPLSTFSGTKKYKDVDGVSGATAASIENSAVKGAAYTSWVLWNRVNGETSAQLLMLTRQTSSTGFLVHCLTGGDPLLAQYALEMLSSGTVPAQEPLTEAVLTALKSMDRSNSRTALDYLKKALPDAAVRNLRLAELSGAADEAAGYQIIETLNAEPDLDARTLETLASQMNRMSYLEVHRVLALIESRHFKSESVSRSVSALAAGDNAFIARRAKEHLSRME